MIRARPRFPWRLTLFLRLGIVHKEESELPGGQNLATSERQIAEFLLRPHFPSTTDGLINLFDLVDRPFRNSLEARLHRVYGTTLWAVRRFPCVLRPLDMVLRALGIRWYGYVQLSNHLWISTR